MLVVTPHAHTHTGGGGRGAAAREFWLLNHQGAHLEPEATKCPRPRLLMSLSGGPGTKRGRKEALSILPGTWGFCYAQGLRLAVS